VRLVGAQIAFLAGAVRREIRKSPGRPANERGRRRQVRIVAGGQRRDRPAIGHRDRERAPRTVARVRDPQRPARQRERVRLSRPVIEEDRRQREDVWRRGVQDERLVELDPVDRAALGAEPAPAGDVLPVERRDRRGDVSAGRSGDLSYPY
jgi:hypothetical protein